MSLSDIKNVIRNVPDFPKSGIQFKDITTALRQAPVFQEILNSLAERYRGQQIDYVAGIESRGFIFGAALAYLLGCGFIPIRKQGKLPAEVLSQEYCLEYGTDRIEMHKDALSQGDRVLIIDDLLATGGTAMAAVKLVQQSGAEVAELAFVIELSSLAGRQKLEDLTSVYALVSY